MLNEEKVRTMNRLALYEQTEGRKYLPVSKYYRSDYIGLALIKNFFLVTIGYILIVGAVGVYFGNYLMENIHKMDIMELGIDIVLGYAVVLLIYTVLTYIQYSVKYHIAKKSVRGYYEELTRLEKMYNREERKPAGYRNTGGTGV
ncbi:MAG: hypothetical protein J6D53_10445 [Blautia sp.]|nr:hypothetical protein [Blautia sp.]